MPNLTGRYLQVLLPSTLSVSANVSSGESAPLSGTVDSSDDNYLETRCIGLQGTHCISGSATGVVVSTADATVFGKIAKMTNAPRTGLTPLEREVLNFVIIICSIMFTMIIVVIIVWYVLQNPSKARC
jgi:sodium/potassium-transporting ATPase subunit alpha